LLLGSSLDQGGFESNDTGIGVVEDSNSGGRVDAFELSALVLAEKDNLELAGLSLAFFVNLHVDLTLHFVGLHGEHHAHGLKVLRAGRGLVDGLYPEGGVLLSLLFNDDGSVALLGGDAVVGVFKSDHRVGAGFLNRVAEFGSTDFGVERVSGTEGHSFNRVLGLKNLEKRVNFDLGKILDSEADFEVLLNTANVFGGARVVGYRIHYVHLTFNFSHVAEGLLANHTTVALELLSLAAFRGALFSGPHNEEQERVECESGHGFPEFDVSG